MPPEDARLGLRQLWQRVADERRRAAAAAKTATRHYELAVQGPESLRPLYLRLARLNRQASARHLATARLSALHAMRMGRWLSGGEGRALRPMFMTAVAEALGARSAVAALHGRRRAAVAVAATDGTARAAHDLEAVMAEGPATEAMTAGAPVAAVGVALLGRWPRYGPAVAGLDVQAVVAAPLGQPGNPVGAVCFYDREPAIRGSVVTTATLIADALTHMLLPAGDVPAGDQGPSGRPLFGEADFQPVVHQAAGMVSVQCGCRIDDAEDLLAARAFADGTSVAEIARQVVHGSTRFC